MVGFFDLKSASLSEQVKTGEAIIRLCESVFDDDPRSEWLAFNENPKAWLHKAGYRYDGAGAGPNGEIPDDVTIVPVYDTDKIMHVRIPWRDLVANPPEVADEPTYGHPGSNRFPVLLARYFMRHCR